MFVLVRRRGSRDESALPSGIREGSSRSHLPFHRGNSSWAKQRNKSREKRNQGMNVQDVKLGRYDCHELASPRGTTCKAKE